MTTIPLTRETFRNHVEGDGIVFVDFWASWCGPCRTFAPIFEAAAARHPDLTWAKVDTQAEPELASALGIRSIPTLMVFRERVLLYAQPGVLPAAALDDLVAQVKGLDMEEIRKKIARAKVA